MDKSPNSRKKPAEISQQKLGNEPQNGERPGQGDVMTNDHYDPQGKPDADKRVLTAPDTLEAKHKFPILAQPPKRLRVGTSSQRGLHQQHAHLEVCRRSHTARCWSFYERRWINAGTGCY
jgi:hypothetical protein